MPETENQTEVVEQAAEVEQEAAKQRKRVHKTTLTTSEAQAQVNKGRPTSTVKDRFPTYSPKK